MYNVKINNNRILMEWKLCKITDNMQTYLRLLQNSALDVYLQ
jgi:hypothetical protein